MPKPGRLPIFNDRKRRELGRVVRANRCATFKEISQLISIKISEDTIRNKLRKLGYASRVAVKKPFLNRKQQKARYIFAKKHDLKSASCPRSLEFGILLWKSIRKIAWRQPSKVAELQLWFGAP